MPILHYAVGACSLAPHVVLGWIGAPCEAVKVQYGSKELLTINPTGAVPTLREDDGWLAGVPAVQMVLAREAGGSSRKAERE